MKSDHAKRSSSMVRLHGPWCRPSQSLKSSSSSSFFSHGTGFVHRNANPNLLPAGKLNLRIAIWSSRQLAGMGDLHWLGPERYLNFIETFADETKIYVSLWWQRRRSTSGLAGFRNRYWVRQKIALRIVTNLADGLWKYIGCTSWWQRRRSRSELAFGLHSSWQEWVTGTD